MSPATKYRPSLKGRVDNYALLREHLREALQLGFVARRSFLARGDESHRGDAVVRRKRLNIGDSLLAVFGAYLGIALQLLFPFEVGDARFGLMGSPP
jgi:hypothetical protein